MTATYPRLLSLLAVREPGRKTAEAVILGAHGPQRFTLWCSCERKRADGSCRHSDFLMGEMRPWYRARMVIRQGDAAPRGGRSRGALDRED